MNISIRSRNYKTTFFQSCRILKEYAGAKRPGSLILFATKIGTLSYQGIHEIVAGWDFLLKFGDLTYLRNK